MNAATAAVGASRTGPAVERRRIPLVTLGIALSAFFALSFVLCILSYLYLGGLPVAHSVLSTLLPGFVLLSWPDFFLGLVESVLWGWYVAVAFGGLYNFVAARVPR